MDPLLILLLIPIVIFIGYVLSRPFENPPDYQVGSTIKDDLREQYDALLHEIKVLQSAVETSDSPDDLKNQIEAKKRQAVKLLRQIKPNLEDESTF